MFNLNANSYYVRILHYVYMEFVDCGDRNSENLKLPPNAHYRIRICEKEKIYVHRRFFDSIHYCDGKCTSHHIIRSNTLSTCTLRAKVRAMCASKRAQRC